MKPGSSSFTRSTQGARRTPEPGRAPTWTKVTGTKSACITLERHGVAISVTWTIPTFNTTRFRAHIHRRRSARSQRRRKPVSSYSARTGARASCDGCLEASPRPPCVMRRAASSSCANRYGPPLSRGRCSGRSAYSDAILDLMFRSRFLMSLPSALSSSPTSPAFESKRRSKSARRG